MNKKLLAALVFGAAGIGAAGIGAAQAQNVGISVNIGAPGFFGRIDLGGAPPPELVYSAPVVVERYERVEAPAPIYLHVPPGHERHWRQHCREYNACGVPVLFVRDRWYNDVYVPHYSEHREDFERRDREDHGRHEGRGEWRGHDDHRDHEDHGDRGDHRDHGDHGDRGDHRDHHDEEHDRDRDR